MLDPENDSGANPGNPRGPGPPENPALRNPQTTPGHPSNLWAVQSGPEHLPQMAKSKKNAAHDHEPQVRNRRARYDFEITDTLECGIKLTGTEIKSVRLGQISLQEGYIRAELEPPTLTLHGVHISEYANASSAAQHEPARPRRLLAHKREIRKLAREASAKGMAIVPLEVTWRNGHAKLVIGLGKGKRRFDKRQSMRAKDDRKQIREQ